MAKELMEDTIIRYMHRILKHGQEILYYPQ